MPHRGRILLGFAVVPFTAALIAMGTYELFWHAGFLPQGAPIHSIDAAQAMFAGVMIIAVPMTLAAAVPGVLWLKRKGWLTLGRLIGLGALLGNVPYVAIVIGLIVVQLVFGPPGFDIGRYQDGLSGFVVRNVMGVAAGAGSAAALWLVSICGTTPDDRRASS